MNKPRTIKPVAVPTAAFLRATRRAYFELYEAPDGWRWRLRTANNHVVAVSPAGHVRRDRCERAIRRVKAAAAAAL